MKFTISRTPGHYSLNCRADEKRTYLGRFLEGVYMEDEIDRVLGLIKAQKQGKLGRGYQGGSEDYALLFKGQTVMFELMMRERIKRKPYDEGELPLDLFEKVLRAWRDAVMKARKIPGEFSWEFEVSESK